MLIFNMANNLRYWNRVMAIWQVTNNGFGQLDSLLFIWLTIRLSRQSLSLSLRDFTLAPLLILSRTIELVLITLSFIYLCCSGHCVMAKMADTPLEFKIHQFLDFNQLFFGSFAFVFGSDCRLASSSALVATDDLNLKTFTLQKPTFSWLFCLVTIWFFFNVLFVVVLRLAWRPPGKWRWAQNWFLVLCDLVRVLCYQEIIPCRVTVFFHTLI